MSGSPPGERTHLTLRRGLGVALLVAMLVLLIGGTVSVVALDRLDAHSAEIVDRISPARIAAGSLTAAYLDQETGVRGYVLARDEAFLAPYTMGRQKAGPAAAQVRTLLPRLGPQLDAISAAGETWRTTVAEPTIAKVRRAGTTGKVRVDEKAGRARFAAVRAGLDELSDTLQAEREVARERVASDLDRVRIVSALVLAGVLFAGVLIWIALRRLVLKPIDRLAAASRVAAEGDFVQPVVVDGPDEIRQLGFDVEQMRGRIVAALAASRVAEREIRAQAAQLAEQADELTAQAEDLRRSNEELEQFAYVASHDLQEPLRKVASFCQMLQRRYGGQLDERADQYIEFAVDGAKRMQQLINDLLTFSRVGRTTAGWEEVDTVLIAQHALSALGDTPAEANARVEFGELPVVHGDNALLTQVFQNLIGNAIKFRAADRPPVIRLAAEREGAQWHFRCEDNGIGIDPQYADRVFVIFQRLHSKDQYSGTGIGLSLCKKIVEYHGGRIWLDPDRDGEPGGSAGTTVHWTLPVEPVAITPAASPPLLREATS